MWEVKQVAVVKPCPRCHKFIPSGLAYCPDCKAVVEAEREQAKERREATRRTKYNRAYNAKRDPKYTKFYNSKAWRVTSKAKLQAVNWKCEGHLHENCTGLACEVHHKIPIQTPEGWDKRLDWDNLEALCTVCHNVRHPEKFKKPKDDGVIDLRTMEH